MYQQCLFGLTLANFALICFSYKHDLRKLLYIGKHQILEVKNSAVVHLHHRYLVGYTLAVAADWLQGSFFYAVYRDGHNLSEEVVGRLFATGFASGAIAATVVGSLADKHGRKRACLSACLLSACSCFTVLGDDLRILFAGRVLGGIGTSLIYTIFESWLLSELDSLCNSVTTRDEYATHIFGTASILNGITSILSGIFSEHLVKATSSTKSPFIASAFLFLSAGAMIFEDWSENYGESGIPSLQNVWSSVKSSRVTCGSSWSSTKKLGFVIFAFESSTYIVVHFWTSVMSSANSGNVTKSNLPLGLIFANFMSAMMLGSSIFTLLSRNYRWMIKPRYIPRYLLLITSLVLISVVFIGSETGCFTLLCVFEACFGIYSPMIASLKVQIVADENRSKIYGMLRIPTNFFVVLTLLFVRKGSLYRNLAFALCSMLLLGSSAILGSRFTSRF